MPKRGTEAIPYDEERCEEQIRSRLDSPDVALTHLLARSRAHRDLWKDDRERGLAVVGAKIEKTRADLLRRAKAIWNANGGFTPRDGASWKQIDSLPESQKPFALMALNAQIDKFAESIVKLSFYEFAKEADFRVLVGFDSAKYNPYLQAGTE